jgi:hypothetical protein
LELVGLSGVPGLDIGKKISGGASIQSSILAILLLSFGISQLLNQNEKAIWATRRPFLSRENSSNGDSKSHQNFLAKIL